jgi:DNA-binding NtrC family response regulator
VTPPPHPPATERREPGPVTVLLADDEPALLRALRRNLADLAVELFTAADGGQALAVMRERHIDVLVADIDMPVLDGLELVRAARRESPATWRILMTGSATMDRTIAAINDGEVVRFFTKPLDPASFHEQMAALIGRVERQRREGVHEVRRARRESLYRWLAERFPGAEAVERETSGEVHLDRSAVAAALSRAGPAARKLIRG